MSDIENYDGLCGVIAPFATSDLQLRCKYCLVHQGEHSWEKYRINFIISSSGTSSRYIPDFLKAFYEKK